MSTAEIPESQTYRHVKCNTETTISGQPFEVMSNPISDMTRTWCGQCNAHVPISEYAWADTNENVVDYYVLHAFQKKSKSGIKTARADMETIRRRLKYAELHYADSKKR